MPDVAVLSPIGSRWCVCSTTCAKKLKKENQNSLTFESKLSSVSMADFCETVKRIEAIKSR